MNNFSLIKFNKTYFNIKDTLECGQIFRFRPYNNGYLVFSVDKCAYCYEDGENTVIRCKKEDRDYFYNFFDLSRDYVSIYENAISYGVNVLTISANLGKGIRILNQNKLETLFSFIISQNNNIPRIKGIIEKLCVSLGEKSSFDGVEYYSFPTVERMLNKDLDFYKSVGLGYRAPYIKRLAESIKGGLDLDGFNLLDTKSLKSSLKDIHGVGPKVADCVSLFGYHRSDSFPVDTWIEKVYREDFKGEIKNRDKIAEHFVDAFKDNSGYFQQYLFYFKRSLEEKN